MGERMVRWMSVAAAGALLGAAACSDDSNTAPLVATSISVVAASNAQTGVVGTALAAPVTVTVTDQNGAAMSNAVVNWSVIAGGGSVASATSTTDASGNASIVWTLGNTIGVDSLKATLTTGASATITATAIAGVATTLSKASGDAQSVPVGATSGPMVVKLTDLFGNPVAGATVSWSVAGGGALSASSTTTDANGMAQVTLTADPTPAAYTITATAGALTAVVFTANGV